MTSAIEPIRLNAEETASFVGGRYTLAPLPNMTLYRLLGQTAQGNWNSVFGQKCWFDERVFFNCVCDARDIQAEPSRALASLRFLLRDRLAVAANWNDFRAFFTLRIPRDANVTAAIGAAATQPFLVDGRAPGRQFGPLMLSGGAQQYIINVQPRINGYLVGPQPLALARA